MAIRTPVPPFVRLRDVRVHSAGLALAVVLVFGISISALTPAMAATPEPSPSAAPTPATPLEANFSLKAGAVAPPNVPAKSWVVADAQTGEVLASKEPHLRLEPASTLKTLTALTVAPWLLPDSLYTATLRDANQKGSRVGLLAGHQYTVHDLLLGLLLPSGNDAASALTNAYKGWPDTIAEMNAEAARLGALDTNAVVPSGLDKVGQVSSSTDLVTIFRELLKNQQLRALIQVKQADFPGRKGKTYVIANQDKLLIDDYPGIIGGKTGYTTRAGNTFVGAAQRDGRTLVASIMRSEGNTEDNMVALLDWGFANANNVDSIAQLPSAGPVTNVPVPRPARQLDQLGVDLAAVAVPIADPAAGGATAGTAEAGGTAEAEGGGLSAATQGSTGGDEDLNSLVQVADSSQSATQIWSITIALLAALTLLILTVVWRIIVTMRNRRRPNPAH